MYFRDFVEHYFRTPPTLDGFVYRVMMLISGGLF